MEDPFLGEITIFAGTYAPYGWSLCDGTILQIRQNTALYALIGTQYGGDGVTTFALPNLIGRLPIHQGTNSTTGTTYVMGQTVGQNSVTLLKNTIPAHSHPITGQINFKTRGDSSGNSDSPDANAVAQAPLKKFFSRVPNQTFAMAPLDSSNIIGPVGNNIPHQNMQPYLPLNFIISMQGNFPVFN